MPRCCRASMSRRQHVAGIVSRAVGGTDDPHGIPCQRPVVLRAGTAGVWGAAGNSGDTRGIERPWQQETRHFVTTGQVPFAGFLRRRDRMVVTAAGRHALVGRVERPPKGGTSRPGHDGQRPSRRVSGRSGRSGRSRGVGTGPVRSSPRTLVPALKAPCRAGRSRRSCAPGTIRAWSAPPACPGLHR